MYELRHIKNALSHPLKTGSMLPSSERLCKLIVDESDIPNAKVIVEFGPGTGVLTEKIIEKMSPESALVVIEINSEFARETRKRCPRASVFNECVSKTPECLRSLGFDKCDRIISGLPWAVFSNDFQKKALGVVKSVLAQDGRFFSFAYKPLHMLPAGRNFRKNLDEKFQEVKKTPTVWKNIPPAFVYLAKN